MPSKALTTAAVPVDKESCRLLGPTALVVQALLGVLVLLSLLYKRHREKPKRKWQIWIFDVSKQVFGQLVVHFANVFIADLTGASKSENPCVLYFLHFITDTTIGVALIYLLLHLYTHIVTHNLHLMGFESGQYGSPPSLSFWTRQAAVYVIALLSMKVVVVILIGSWGGIFTIGEWLLSWTEGPVQVIFVMGLFPIVMNIISFWITDSIIKYSGAPSSTKTDAEDLADSEPLFALTDDDQDLRLLHSSEAVDAARVHELAVGASTAVSLSDPKSPISSGRSTPRPINTSHGYPPQNPSFRAASPKTVTSPPLMS